METRPPQQPVPSTPTAGEDPSSRIEPGTVVAGRWRVTRRRGAMRLDEIYEANDVATGETVALRVILRDDGHDDATFRRFTRVARRLTRIRHPNVQRILGFVSYESERGATRERVSLLVTDVVNGETLSRRVRREGPLRGEAADSFVSDVCHALDAIHGMHVLHGDLTGASVLFVAAEGGRERAVVTDLAFLASGEGDDQAMARAVGSPAYRAPEQLTGGKLHRATDIFSLGAVIYEAVTARLPFTGGNLLALDFRQLEEEPRPPSEVVPGIDPALERAILRCLERAPANRFERATEILHAMRGEDVATPRVRQTVRTLSAASLLFALMLGGRALMSWVSVLEDRKLGVELVVRARPAVAVMPIRADRLTSRDSWIAIAAAELIRLELSRDDALRVASLEAITGACADLGLTEIATMSPEALRHINTLIGSEQLLVGSCRTTTTDEALTVTLDLCVQDTHTGEIVGTVLESGDVKELPDLAARLAARIRPILGVPPAQRGRRSPRLETWSPAGLEAYARGVASLDAKRLDDAVSALRLAATTDAENPTVRLALSHAFWLSGNVSRAIDEAKLGWDESEGLSRERALELELRHAELRGDPVRLIEIYRRIIRTYPDRIDQGFGLVGTLIRARDLDDAQRALRSLQSATPSVADPRIALLQSRIESQRGHHSEALAVARDAASRASDLTARRLFAEAEERIAQESAALGDDVGLRAALERAEEAYRFRGDLDEVARITALRATFDEQAGRDDDALASLREAERLYTQIGQRQGIAATQGSIAILLASRGRQRAAAQQFAAALDGFVAISDDMNAMRSRIGLAGSLSSLGALAAAEAQLRAVLASPPEQADSFHRGLAFLGLAKIDTARGNVDRSRRLLDRASEQFESFGFAEGNIEVDMVRGVDSWLSGDEPAARRTLGGARRRALERRDDIPACRAALLLARVDAASGDATSALALAGDCIATLAAHGSPADTTMAKAIAATASLRLGDRDRATKILGASWGGPSGDEDFAARAAADIARELLRGEGSARLLRLADDARDASMPTVELDALLAAAEIAAQRGTRATRATALDRAETVANGLDLIGYARLIKANRIQH